MGDRLDAKKSQIKSMYGLEFIDFMKMWWNQDKSCRICKCAIIPMKSECFPNTETACIDHDHNTGKVLGLLCNNCNSQILGKAKEDSNLLQKAAEYLIETGKVSKNPYDLVKKDDTPPKIETQVNLNKGLFKLMNG